MNIKISTLRSILHDSNDLSFRSKSFIESIEKELNNEIVFADISDYDCDLKLIFVETGGSEMLFKNQFDSLKEPFYFLTSGENNSLAASLEILTYLNTIGKKGEILHGSASYIAKRISELSNKKINILDGYSYGVIGSPSDWLISSIPNEKALEDKFGVKLVYIPLEEVINEFNKDLSYEEVSSLGFSEKEISKASKVNHIIEGIVKKYSLNGLTIRCFDLLDTIKTTGCLALAIQNKNGIISTCEGDIMAMISMAIAKKVSGNSSFQANPSRIDTNENTILFAHCTLPLDMTVSYKFKTHFESGIGVAIKGELKEDTVTVFRLSSDLTHYFVSKGKIIKNLEYDNLCRTQILVKLDKNVNELLTNPCGNHHIIFYGDYVDEINKLFN